MLTLAGLLHQTGKAEDLGSPAQAGDAAWLYRRVWRAGGDDARHAAQHMAMSCFNTGNLAGYRLWLRRAHMLGDNDAGLELDRFETRLPFGNARAIGRGRPWRRSER